MTVHTEKTRIDRDLSLLAIDAAEELERMRKGIKTDFKSTTVLASILQESFSNVSDSNANYRLDRASVFLSAISTTSGSTITKKTISEIAKEAIDIASRLNSGSTRSEESELEKLISFCVALSDSAALYREEVEDLIKHFA